MIGAALQKAIFAALTTSPAIAGGRVYDRVPAGPTFPYVSIGDEQVLDDGDTCSDGWEVTSDVHVWSRPAAGSKAEVKDLAAAIVPRLAVTTISVTGFRVLIAELETSRVFRDPDGITEHAVLTFRHVLSPN
jgi:hypothetical protein